MEDLHIPLNEYFYAYELSLARIIILLLRNFCYIIFMYLFVMMTELVISEKCLLMLGCHYFHLYVM
jgi:hypothetical protein